MMMKRKRKVLIMMKRKMITIQRKILSPVMIRKALLGVVIGNQKGIAKRIKNSKKYSVRGRAVLVKD